MLVNHVGDVPLGAGPRQVPAPGLISDPFANQLRDELAVARAKSRAETRQRKKSPALTPASPGP